MKIMKCPRCGMDIPEDAMLCCYCGRVFRKKAPSRVHQRPNGTGTAYKRGNLWTAEVTLGYVVGEDGKRHRRHARKGGFKTKTEALAYCDTLLNMKLPQKKTAPTLAAYWETYSGGEMESLSKDKRVAYKIAWKKMQSLALRPIDTLTVSDLRRVVSENTSTYYPAHDMKVLFSHLFKLGAADGWCSKDLPSFIIMPDKNEKEREPFTEDEQKALWQTYESGCRYAAIPLIMIYTGMMPGELRQLTTDKIDYENRRIIGAGLKTDVRRASAVYLPTDILPVLQDASQGDSGCIWKCSEDNFYKRYYEALAVAGVRRLTPYSCRHTTATALAISENVAPETVRKIMRWSTTAMLSRYAHPSDSDAIAAVDTLKRKVGSVGVIAGVIDENKQG